MVAISAAATKSFSLVSTNYCCNPPFYRNVSINGKSISMVTQARKREDETENAFTKFNLNLSSSSSSKLLVQSAIGLFAFGFVDAGYSGDWSRIGAISKDTEELCKMLSFVIVPLSIFLIYILSAKGKE